MAMELELGLALPSNPTKGLDLNRYGFEPNEPLGSDPFTTTTTDQRAFKKRCFEQGVEAVPQSLALLLRSNHPNEEDDNAYNELDQNSSTLNKSDGDDEGVVGWPPIKSWTKKLCHQNRSGGALRFAFNAYCGANNRGGVKSSYVKVKMEGVAIARKVDLSLHGSYETLMDTLFGMFGRGQENSLVTGQGNVEDFKLAYQDRDGDWLLAGDVPWSSFVQAVQRLKLVKISNQSWG